MLDIFFYSSYWGLHLKLFSWFSLCLLVLGQAFCYKCACVCLIFFPSSFFERESYSGLIIAFQLGAVLKEFQLSSFWCEDLLEGFSHSNTLRSRDQNLWTGGPCWHLLQRWRVFLLFNVLTMWRVGTRCCILELPLSARFQYKCAGQY